jgi:hypothetical protein
LEESPFIASVGEYLDEPGQEFAERALQYVRPIYGATPTGAIDGIGSSVLMRRANHRYLATANHVLQHNVNTICEYHEGGRHESVHRHAGRRNQ